MDINDLRSAITVLSLAVFLGIVAWAWSRRRQESFDDAARLPFMDEGEVATKEDRPLATLTPVAGPSSWPA